MRFGRAAAMVLAALSVATPSFWAVAKPAKPATVEQVGDWRLVCQEVGSRCAMVQEILTKVGENGRRGVLLRLTVTHDRATKRTRMLTETPLGIDLVKGLSMEVDGTKRLRLPLKSCDKRGCRVNASLAEDYLTLMQHGAQIYVAYWPSTGGKGVRVAASLKGFTAGFRRLSL